jgi:polar amino acid transport system substrate-binding protein
MPTPETLPMATMLIRTALLSMLICLAACQQDQAPAPAAPDGEPSAAAMAPSAAPAADEAPAGDTALADDDAPCVLRMGYDIWAPYHFEAPDGTVMGIEIDLFRDLMKGSGCTIEFVREDWVNLLQMIQDGSIDVVPGATAVAGREDYAWFSIPYRQEIFEIFVRDGTELPSRNLLELAGSGMRIGLTDAYFYGSLVDLAQQQHPEAFSYSAIAEGSLLNLVEGRVDLVVEEPYVTHMILLQHNWHDEVHRTGLEVANTPVSYMFSKRTTSGRDLLDFNLRLADYLAGPRDEAILGSYLEDL